MSAPRRNQWAATVALIASATLLAASGSARAQAAPGSAEASDASTADLEQLTTDVRAEDDPDMNPLRSALRLPGLLTEMLLLPLYPVLYAIERWDLPVRLFDLVTNEDHTIAILPLIDFVNLRSGPGFGGILLYNDPFGSADRMIFFGLGRANGDREVSLSVVHRLPRLNGRRISISGRYRVERDVPYYGLGDERARRIERLIRIDAIDAAIGLTLFDEASDFDADIQLAFRFRKMGTGVDFGAGAGSTPGLVEGDVLATPIGFGKALNYPEVSATILYDSRDSIGRTSRGIQARAGITASHDIDRSDTGGFRIDAKITGFIPVLPLQRALVLTLGMAAAFPVTGSDDDIPLHMVPELGGSDTLRGYVSSRFVDRFAWWASAEYRYPAFLYGSTGNGMSAFVFFDVGNVARDPNGLFDDPIPWSVGFGLRAEASLFLIGRLQIAASPEGFRVSVGVGELP